MHIKSRKFLQLSPKHRARAAGSYQVVLDPKGSEDAWLTLHPRFKFQVEGSPVLNRDVLQMHSSRRQLSLHYGDSAAVGAVGDGGGALSTAAAAADGARPEAALPFSGGGEPRVGMGTAREG